MAKTSSSRLARLTPQQLRSKLYHIRQRLKRDLDPEERKQAQERLEEVLRLVWLYENKQYSSPAW